MKSAMVVLVVQLLLHPVVLSAAAYASTFPDVVLQWQMMDRTAKA
jgi:hypothetical protein